MFSRFVAILIVLFWLTMTGLLIRNQIGPGDAALREVPFSHVVKLLFLHGQPSDLNISNNKLRLGHLRIQPRIDFATKTRVVEFAGNLQIVVPGGKRQRLAWKGDLQMGKDMTTQRFFVEATVHEPADMTSSITLLPGENRAHYELRNANGAIERQDYSLDEKGAQAVLQQAGIDPTLLQNIDLRQSAMPEIKAEQASLATHGEHIDAYRVSIERSGQTFLEFYVDELGHVLQATTIIGYTLTPDDLGGP